MERIAIRRAAQKEEKQVIHRDIKRESDIFKKLEKYIDSSGFIEYPGWEPAHLRKGSSVYELIQWHLYSQNSKPLDYEIFKLFLKEISH